MAKSNTTNCFEAGWALRSVRSKLEQAHMDVTKLRLEIAKNPKISKGDVLHLRWALNTAANKLSGLKGVRLTATLGKDLARLHDSVADKPSRSELNELGHKIVDATLMVDGKLSHAYRRRCK